MYDTLDEWANRKESSDQSLGGCTVKELYETPEAKLIGFAPLNAIAADWDWSKSVKGAAGSSEIDADWGENPEGNFGK